MKKLVAQVESSVQLLLHRFRCYINQVYTCRPPSYNDTYYSMLTKSYYRYVALR